MDYGKIAVFQESKIMILNFNHITRFEI